MSLGEPFTNRSLLSRYVSLTWWESNPYLSEILIMGYQESPPESLFGYLCPSLDPEVLNIWDSKCLSTCMSECKSIDDPSVMIWVSWSECHKKSLLLLLMMMTWGGQPQSLRCSVFRVLEAKCLNQEMPAGLYVPAKNILGVSFLRKFKPRTLTRL